MMFKLLSIVSVAAVLISQIEGARKCEDDCKDILRLLLPAKELKIVHNKLRIVKIVKYPETVTAYIGHRRVRAEMVLTVFKTVPEYSVLKSISPDKQEMKEWIKRNKCKIGQVCPPGGNCWGEDAQMCRDHHTTNWVSSAAFMFEGDMYLKDLFRTCIKEWECWLTSREVDVYYETGKGPYVRLGSENTYLDHRSDTFVKVDGDVVYIDATHDESFTQFAECLEYDKENFCQLKIDGTNYIINFLQGSTCTSIRNIQICFSDSPSVSSADARQQESAQAKAATMGDVKEVEDMVRASFIEAMYNDMILRSYLQNVMEVLNKVIVSESRINPMIISDILRLDVSSHWTPLGIKMCSCLPIGKDSCEWTKSELKTSQNTSHCDTDNNKTTTFISLYGDENFTLIVPDHLNLRTVGQTILETMSEHQLMNEKMYMTKPSSVLNEIPGVSAALGFLDVKEMIWHILPLLNFCLIFFILAKSYMKK